MEQKRSYKTYTKEFKAEAVNLVTEQGYSVAEAAKSIGGQDQFTLSLEITN